MWEQALSTSARNKDLWTTAETGTSQGAHGHTFLHGYACSYQHAQAHTCKDTHTRKRSATSQCLPPQRRRIQRVKRSDTCTHASSCGLWGPKRLGASGTHTYCKLIIKCRHKHAFYGCTVAGRSPSRPPRALLHT